MLSFFRVTDTRWNYSLGSFWMAHKYTAVIQRLCHKSLKANTTMPIGIMGSKRWLIEF